MAFSRIRSYAALLNPIAKVVNRPRSFVSSAAALSSALVSTTGSPLHVAFSTSACADKTASFSAALDVLVQGPPLSLAQVLNPGHAFPWDTLIDIYIRDRFCLDLQLASHKFQVAEDLIQVECPYIVRIYHAGKAGSCGIDRDLFVGNVLIALYVNSRQMNRARKVFDGMPETDEITCNAMVLGYAFSGMWAEFSEFLELNLHVNNAVAWNAVIAGYLHMGNHQEGLSLISRMAASGSAPDFATLLTGLNVCYQIRSIKPGMEIHGLAIRMHCHMLGRFRNTLTLVYSHCGKIEFAHVLYRLYRDNAPPYERWFDWNSWETWNAVIATFISARRWAEALWVFRDMVNLFPAVQHITILKMIISLCARAANFRHALELHCYITRHNLANCSPVWYTLVDMYARLGRTSSAQRVFHLMVEHRLRGEQWIRIYKPTSANRSNHSLQ